MYKNIRLCAAKNGHYDTYLEFVDGRPILKTLIADTIWAWHSISLLLNKRLISCRGTNEDRK